MRAMDEMHDSVRDLETAIEHWHGRDDDEVTRVEDEPTVPMRREEIDAELAGRRVTLVGVGRGSGR